MLSLTLLFLRISLFLTPSIRTVHYRHTYSLETSPLHYTQPSNQRTVNPRMEWDTRGCWHIQCDQLVGDFIPSLQSPAKWAVWQWHIQPLIPCTWSGAPRTTTHRRENYRIIDWNGIVTACLPVKELYMSWTMLKTSPLPDLHQTLLIKSRYVSVIIHKQ